MTVREAALEEVRPLRHKVLRAGRPFDSTVSKDDARPEMRHLVAIAGADVVGVVSYFPEPAPSSPGESAIRFRGMAVDPAWQGRGIGRMLMDEVMRRARAAGAVIVWANGRDTAQSFYERVGFSAVGDGFLDSEMHLGHHVVITRIDEPPPGRA